MVVSAAARRGPSCNADGGEEHAGLGTHRSSHAAARLLVCFAPLCVPAARASAAFLRNALEIDQCRNVIFTCHC